MQCEDCIQIFSTIGEAFNSPIETPELLERAARAIVKQMNLKGCHFRLLSQDQRILEPVASYGLSHEFLDKGPVDAEKSVAEALAGSIVQISDCATDPRVQYPAAHTTEGIVSTLTIPLYLRGQVIGIMRLSSAKQREFSKLEIRVAEVVASFATRAIVHSMFHAILDNVTEVIRGSLDQNTVLEGIVKVVCEDLRAKGCTIHLRVSRKGSLVRRADYGLNEQFLNHTLDRQVQRIAEDMGVHCIQVFDPAKDDRISSPEGINQEGISSLLFIPLVILGESAGVLGLFTHHPYLFSDDEIFFMRSIGDQCALAIQNAQMYAALKAQHETLIEDFHNWFGDQSR